MAGFDGYGMPSVDFSTLGNLGKTYDDARLKAGRERTLAELGQGGNLDYAKASQALLAAGDTEGGLSLARLAEARSNRGADDAWRRENAAREQKNSDRDFGLKSELAKEKPAIVWQDDENGNKVPYLQDPRNPDAIKRLQPGGAPAVDPANPYAAPGKLTAEQVKDRMYADRTAKAHAVISENEGVNQGSGAIMGTIGNASLPGMKGTIRDTTAFNAASSKERQSVDQAQRDFINAVLRKESGAAINQSEFDNARRQYFTQPGDSPEVIAQKRTNRMTEIEGLMAGAGKGYKPPAGYVGTKGPAGQQTSPQSSAAPALPKAGEVRDGYRYRGGDPANPQSWMKM